ncbi:hypothetical protein M5689_014566 [Euphorbia peplus]|nr:hypothetical protein M5689_014566 [Euphorbia peplus]
MERLSSSTTSSLSSYTSMKDLLLESPPASRSSTLDSSSWHEIEISIKNPLLKQAARAYLQCSVLDDPRKEKCGCLLWLNEVVFKPLKDFFSVRRESLDDNLENEGDNNNNNI